MKNIINNIQKNMSLRKTTDTARKFFGACMMFAMVTSWAYGIIPGLKNFSPKVKNVEAANVWSMRQEINILDAYLGAATATYATSSAIINIDTTKYSGTVSYYVEVIASSSSALATNFYLKNLAGQTIATMNPSLTTSYDLYRSASFTPTAGANDYVLVIGNESGATKGVKAARIVILQSFAGTANSAATSTQTQIEIGSATTTANNTTTLPLQYPKYWYYDSTKWDGSQTFYVEATYKLASYTASSTTYTTSGAKTYVVSSGVGMVQVEAWGGGGSGFDGSNSGGGAGGGGGAYAKSTTTVTAGSSISMTVGSGGIGSGQAGADSTFNTTVVVADGGLGGSDATTGEGTGGTVANSTGDIKFAGGQGGSGNGGDDSGGGGGGSGGPHGTGGAGADASTTAGGGGGEGSGGAAGSGTTGGTGGPGGDGGNGGNGGVCTAGGSADGIGGGGAGGADQAGTACAAGTPGGGGGGAETTGPWNGGTGQIKLTEYKGQVGIALEESDGTGDGFTGWAFKKMIVQNGIATTSTRIRSTSFTPTSGRNYRLVASTTNSGGTYDIYNAKIVVDQTSGSEFTKLETQYLLANTLLASGTGLQTTLTKWDSSEWSGVLNTYIHQVEANNNSTSVATVNTVGDTLVTGSTVTSPDNRGISSSMTMPANGNLDMKATTNNGDIYASRILVQVTPSVSIGGTVYTAPDGATPATSKTIQLYKNGSTSLGSGVTNGSGVYSVSLSTSISSGDIITAYVDGDTDGVTVYVSDGTSKSDITIYQGALTVRDDVGSGITNANLTTGIVSSDTGDMVHTTDGSNNLTVATNVELHVWTGDTYNPLANFITQGTGNLHVDDNATASNNGGTGTVGGDLVVDTGGTFNIVNNISINGGDITTAGTAIVNETGGSPTVTLSGTGSIGGGSNALTFSNLTISGTISGSASMTITDTLTISSGSLSLSGGTVTMATTGWGITNSGTLTFSGLTISETPTVQPSSSFSVSGALTVNASKTLAPTAGTITMTGGSIVNNNTLNFYNLGIAGTVTTSSTFGVTNNMTSTSGTLTTSGGTITVTGDLSVAGTITGTGSVTVNGGDVTGNGTLNLTSGTFLLDGIGLFGGNTNWTFNRLTFGDGTGLATTTSTGTNSITTATTTVSTNQIFDAGVSKTWNLTASHEPFVLQGFLLASSSTFSYQSVNHATVTPATYYNLELAPPSGTPTYKLGTTTGQTITINNNFTIAGAGNVTVDVDTRDPVVNVLGNMIVGSGDTYQTSSASACTITGDLSLSGIVSGTGSVSVNGGDVTGSGTLNLSGGNFTLSGTGSFGSDTAWTFYDLTFGIGGSGTATVIGTGGLSITNTLTVATNQLLNAGGKTYTFTGVGTPFVLTGVWNAGTSTIAYNATAGGQTIKNTTYNNLTVAPASGTNTFTFAAGTTLVNKDFTISNTTSSTVTANTNDSTLTVSGTFTIGSGTVFVAPPTSLLTLAGNFTNNGTFTANGGTTVFSTTTSSIISSTADMSFYNFRAIVPGATMKFQKHTTNVPTFTIAGTMTVTGSESTPVYLESDTESNDWMINFSGAQSAITYTSIRDSACSGSSASVTSYITNTNRGNNDSCWGFLVYSIFSAGPASSESESGGGTLVTGGGGGPSATSTEQGGGGGSGQTGGGGGGGGEVSP